MSNDDIANKEKQVRDGDEAKAVLNNNAFVNAFLKYQGELFKAFTTSEPDDMGIREDIYKQMKSLDNVERNLRKAIEAGKIAKNALFNNNEVI